MKFSFFFILMLMAAPSAFAGTGEVVDVFSKGCEHGLNQPQGGDFAVFVFCDDAVGTQIGIILTRPAAGPVQEDTDWSVYNRFWQEGPWMANVLEMVWSESGNYLYVTTSEIYSEEALWEVDIPQRKATKLLDSSAAVGTYTFEEVTPETIVVKGNSFKRRK